MPRVAGTDPGTSSLDLLVLDDGTVADQCRFLPDQLRADPALPVRWLSERGPLDLIAGPSGYGLPPKRLRDCDERDLELLRLVRPDESGLGQGVVKFSAILRALRDAPLPVTTLPGIIHLPTVPDHRKVNRIDMGTADKLCVAALAIALLDPERTDTFCLVELGSAFTACLVVELGRLVDGLGGTSGPMGWQSGGAWDGETAYLLSPLSKGDLFAGGVQSQSDPATARLAFRESLIKAVAGLHAVTAFRRVVLSGRLLETETGFVEEVTRDLTRLAEVRRLPSLPGAWVKHAAQGAALIADGLAGGNHAGLVRCLEIDRAARTALDWLEHPRADSARGDFGVGPRPAKTPDKHGHANE
jgi:predicted butyrate kinase (DUF1464 family)